MIHYDFKGRLQYIPGGALSVQMSAWPVAAGANWWEPTTGSFTCVAAYQAIGAASLAASYVNLANPGTNDLTEGDAPTFDTSYGWDFNGSSDVLYTGVVPTTDYTAIVRFSDGGTADNYIFGTFNNDTNAAFGIRANDGWGAKNYYNAGDVWSNGGLTSGVFAIAGKAVYKDGAYSATIPAGSGSWTNDLTIGGRNTAPFGIAGYTNARIQAVAIYSTTLDATQIAEITTNMQAL